MREVFIKYNPYQLKTEITVDGSKPRSNSRLNFGDSRLQEWIENLPDILLEEYGEKNFEITFNGTVLDYEDVAAMVVEAEKHGMKITLKHIKAKEVGDKEEAISEIFEEIQNGPFEELRQPDVIRAFEMAKSSDFEVNVVATMSAGKSTLINSLLRERLMPAKQEACTAVITEIKDNDSDVFNAKVYNSDGRLLEQHSELTYEIMDDLNKNPEVSKIRIEGDIPFVTAEDVSLVLVDTPGPNNSRDPEHKAATYRMLSESSKTVVLYIMNATQLAVNDDFNLLQHVAESMKVGGKQSRDRFIFVLNKLDDFKQGEDSVESAIAKVRDYLKDNGIENPNIYPASALTALNIRTILSGDNINEGYETAMARLKMQYFNLTEEMHFEKYAPLTASVRNRIEKELEEAEKNGDEKAQALIHSGIVPVEQAIRMYVQKYAKTAKIKNIADTFVKKLESAQSFEETKKEIAGNENAQKVILEKIDAINAKLQNGEEAKRFKTRINNINYDKEIKKLLNDITNKYQGKITAQLTAPSKSNEISREEADKLCAQFEKFAETLQAEIRVEFENVIDNHIRKNADSLMEEYTNKLADLAEDIGGGANIKLDPFTIMKGSMANAESIISETSHTKKVKVDEVWIENTSKRWWKPWTWFQASGHYKSVYEDREFVTASELAQKYFAPIQDNLYENNDNAAKYAKSQTEKIKQAFSERFDKLDKILADKLAELEECASDSRDVEARIAESQKKLDWLESIQAKIDAILDI